MHKMSVNAIKSYLDEILEWVKAGEEVLIMQDGHAVARIEAVPSALKSLSDLAKIRRTLPVAKTSNVDLMREIRNEGY